jgi:hypothetical protein
MDDIVGRSGNVKDVFTSTQEWQAAATALQIEKKTLYDLDHSQLKSASKIEEAQYICLRAIWTLRPSNAFKPDRWGLSLKDADKFLSKNESWLSYLERLDRDVSQGIPPIIPAPQLGTFSLVYYKQRLLHNIKPNQQAKIITNPDFSPVANRTRNKAKARAAGGNLQTPTKQFSRLKIGSSSDNPDMKSLVGDEERSGAATDSDDEESWEETSKQTPRTRLKALSPSSPATFNIGEAPEDEAIVNASLVVLLNALTIHVPLTTSHWTERRKRFVVEAGGQKLYEAITDGHLSKIADDTSSRVILEVKPVYRATTPRVRRQESAQMAAWIFAEPDVARTWHHQGGRHQ